MCSPIWSCYIQTATDNFTQRSEKAPLASFVKSDAFWLLEPNAGKLARSVLRGGGSREATSLPSETRVRFPSPAPDLSGRCSDLHHLKILFTRTAFRTCPIWRHIF